jgi:hypothetical protein
MFVRHARIASVVAGLALVAAVPFSAQANHSWNGYHWARTANPFTVKVIDSMTPDWDNNLAAAIGPVGAAVSAWNTPTGDGVYATPAKVLTAVRESGDSSSVTRTLCPPVSGKVRVCNAAYGRNGWLGIAQVWVSGSHITQGVAKMNDSYLASSSYSEINRQHVLCQEAGHDWGLSHQSETGEDLGTCMDYAYALDNPNPNYHDFQELASIYAHLDSTSTAARAAAAGANAASVNVRARENWGAKVHEAANGSSAIFVRRLGRGMKVVTHVTWAR